MSPRSSREVLSAYIQTIPALQQHPTMVVFDLFPFIWQFELIILEHLKIPGTDIKINPILKIDLYKLSLSKL